MTPTELLIAFYGIVHREVARWLRIWSQSLLPPVITAILYCMIFGTVIGRHIGMINHVPYINFMIPGLMMMSAIQNAYANVSSSYFGSKFSRSIEEMLVSPMPPWIMVSGYAVGGTLRGMISATLVFIVGQLFAPFPVAHPALMILAFFSASLLFSIGGLINGALAMKFDDTSVFVTFILTPFIYLGGVFYDIHALHGFWRTLSFFNPIFYLVELFRYTALNIGDTSLLELEAIVLGCIVMLFLLANRLIKRGTRTKV